MTTDPTTTAQRADAMTEEAPRDLADLTASALAVVTAAQADDGNHATAWNLAVLARQVAELAQHVARLDTAPADSIGDAFARGYIEGAGTTGRTYDDDPDSERSEAYDHGRELRDRTPGADPAGAPVRSAWPYLIGGDMRPCAAIYWHDGIPAAVCAQPYGTEHSHADHTAAGAIAAGIAWKVSQ